MSSLADAVKAARTLGVVGVRVLNFRIAWLLEGLEHRSPAMPCSAGVCYCQDDSPPPAFQLRSWRKAKIDATLAGLGAWLLLCAFASGCTCSDRRCSHTKRKCCILSFSGDPSPIGV